MAFHPGRQIRARLPRIGHTLGSNLGPADLEGSVHSIVFDCFDAADRPAWARALTTLALAPTLVGLASAVAIGQLLTRYLRPQRRSGGAPLVYGLAGFGVAKLLERRQHRMIQVWKLDTARGRRVVRIAIEPSHGADVRPNDAVECWGKPHPDGTFRAYHAVNRSTSAVIHPTHVSPLVVAGAFFWAFLVLVFVASLI